MFNGLDLVAIPRVCSYLGKARGAACRRRSRGRAGFAGTSVRGRGAVASTGLSTRKRRRDAAINGNDRAGSGARAVGDEEGDRLGDITRRHLTAEQRAARIERLELVDGHAVGFGSLTPHLVRRSEERRVGKE